MREHNEDAHYFDADKGIFVVCDGMGGHAAGEVASEMAIRTIRSAWGSRETQQLIDTWSDRGTPEARLELLQRIRAGATQAHEAIVAAGSADEAKSGMGTTLVGALVIGNELVFAQAGDSRAYIVRDGIAMQLTEDHTLLARLQAAGIEVDLTGEGSRFRSMLTNALGIGQESRITTFIVPLADGDRFLLCSDGISEYVPEVEVGTVLTSQPSPARAAQKLIDLALARGGGDNATAVVVRVLEAGETPQPAAQRKRDSEAIATSPLWGRRLSPQGRLRALRIAMERDFAAGKRLPPHAMGDRVAWIIVDGELELAGERLRTGSCVYPESLAGVGTVPERDAQATVVQAVRALAIRANDWRELCEDDTELGEVLVEALAQLLEARGFAVAVPAAREERPHTSSELAEPPPPVAASVPAPGATPGARPGTRPGARAEMLDAATIVDRPPVMLDAPTVRERKILPNVGTQPGVAVATATTPPSGLRAIPAAARAESPSSGIPRMTRLETEPGTGSPEVTPSSGIPIATVPTVAMRADEPRRPPTSPPPLSRRAQTSPGVATRPRPPSKPPGLPAASPGAAPPGLPAPPPTGPASSPSRHGANVVARRMTPAIGIPVASPKPATPSLPPRPIVDAPTAPRATPSPVPGAIVDAPTVPRAPPIPAAAMRPPARTATPAVGVPIQAPPRTTVTIPPARSGPTVAPEVARPSPPPPPTRPPAAPAPPAPPAPSSSSSPTPPSGARAKRVSEGWDD